MTLNPLHICLSCWAFSFLYSYYFFIWKKSFSAYSGLESVLLNSFVFWHLRHSFPLLSSVMLLLGQCPRLQVFPLEFCMLHATPFRLWIFCKGISWSLMGIPSYLTALLLLLWILCNFCHLNCSVSPCGSVFMHLVQELLCFLYLA